MNIPLEQSIGSVVRYIKDRDGESIKAYFDEVPEGYAVPSLYFPVPYIECRKVSLRSFRISIMMEVWVMDRSNWEAEKRAAALRDSLLLDDLVIPVRALDGKLTGKSIRTLEPTQRKIDTGVVSLNFTVREYIHAEASAVKAEHIYTVWKMISQEEGGQADGNESQESGDSPGEGSGD